jgi:hypothetical protein
MSFKIEQTKFLLDSLGTSWTSMPEEDQLALMNIWMGYVQLAGEQYSKLYQYDYNKSLSDIQHYLKKTWRKFNIWNYHSCEEDPVFDYDKLNYDNVKWDSKGYIDCSFTPKGSGELYYKDLNSTVDNQANLYWEAKIYIDSLGAGGQIGYFNKYNSDLTNSISFCWDSGKVYGVICDDSNNIEINSTSEFMQVKNAYVITATYLASGGNLEINCYDTNNNLLDSTFVGISTIETLASGGTSGVFECNRFGLGNINYKNNYDHFKDIVSTSGTARVSNIGYADPSFDISIQSIPTLQSQLDEPLSILTYGTDYNIIGSEFYFPTIIPATYLWAEKVYYDNDAVESNFGSLVDYRKDLLEHTTKEYLNNVKGMWHSYVFGPTISNIEVGLSILANEPYSLKDGTISYITSDYNTLYGLIIIRPSDGGEELPYLFKKVSGIAINPRTGVEYRSGDEVKAYEALSDALSVVDDISSPNWWLYHLLNTTSNFTLQKYKSFGIALKPIELTPMSLSIMVCNFINHLKPSDTRAWFTMEDFTPLFVVGNHEYLPYVVAEIIGDENIFLPGEFVYNGSNEIRYSPSREDLLPDEIDLDELGVTSYSIGIGMTQTILLPNFTVPESDLGGYPLV